jgi:hypothetical protein
VGQGSPELAEGDSQSVSAGRVIRSARRDLQRRLHLCSGNLNVTEQVELILFLGLMKPGAVRTMEALQTVLVARLAMTQEALENDGAVSGSGELISRRRHAVIRVTTSSN